MGRYYYMVCICIGVGMVIGAGLVDAILSTEGGDSITGFLRKHPAWYWWPAAAIVTVIVVLGIHLFGNGRGQLP